MLDKFQGGDLRSIGRSNEVVADIKENPKLIEKEYHIAISYSKALALVSHSIIE